LGELTIIQLVGSAAKLIIASDMPTAQSKSDVRTLELPTRGIFYVYLLPKPKVNRSHGEQDSHLGLSSGAACTSNAFLQSVSTLV
jgi:hypothetical protein